MTALYAIVTVVRTHDAGRPRVHAILKVRKINFLLRSLIAGNAALETGVLHIVERVMLHAGHDVLILHASDQRGPHLTYLIGLLAVGLLASSPTGIVGHVDADSCKKISPKRTDLPSDAVSYLLLQGRVKGCSSGHGNREACGLIVSTDNAARPVSKEHGRNVFLLDTTGCIGNHIIVILVVGHIAHHLHQLFLGHLGNVDVSTHQPYLLLKCKLIHNFLSFLCHRKTIFLCCSHVLPPFLSVLVNTFTKA